MTPEREKYLSSISEWEKEVRKQIHYLKWCIKQAKKALYSPHLDDYAMQAAKMELPKLRRLLLLFKKQLPAPMLVYKIRSKNNRPYSIYTCSCCDFRITPIDQFCPICGQALSNIGKYIGLYGEE